MTRLGAKVTGIDASEKNINVAKFHAEQMNLKINYLATTPENLNEHFDVILCLEIIEHVADVDLFIKSCSKLLKKMGLYFLQHSIEPLNHFYLQL
jgi:2-polyprenyl-6-hydroxyphenyl methylase/3-demethylubiquinone-9 3-methyltransferase